MINKRCEIACNIKQNECLVLMGMNRGISVDDVFDLIILLGKQYIYLFLQNAKMLPKYYHVYEKTSSKT